jgi:hypothetical protein
MKKKAMDKEDIYQLGLEAGRQAAESVRDVNPAVEDNKDLWVEQAIETEEDTRNFSPVEFMGTEEGSEFSSYEHLDEYERGVSDGIHTIIFGEKVRVSTKKYSDYTLEEQDQVADEMYSKHPVLRIDTYVKELRKLIDKARNIPVDDPLIETPSGEEAREDALYLLNRAIERLNK